MKIEVGIQNFKSIKKTKLCLNDGLNILVGPNGAGKSCLFSSLKFLRDIFVRGTAQAMASAGGPKHVYNRGSNEIILTICVDYGKRLYQRKESEYEFHWQITIKQRGKDEIAEITEERVGINTFDGNEKIELFNMVRKLDKRGKPILNIFLEDQKYFGWDLFSEWKSEFRNKEEIPSKFKKFIRNLLPPLKNSLDVPALRFLPRLDVKILQLINSLVALNEYNIIPDVARTPTEQLPFAFMKPDGSGIAEVINALETKQFHKLDVMDSYYLPESYFYYNFSRMRYYPSLFRRRGKYMGNINVLDNIQNELTAAVHSIDGITTKIDPSTGKRFVIFKSNREKFTPEEISDGTIKWLCILVSIYVPYSHVYLIEEPENFLHPWMQQKLVATMRRQSEENKTIFLITTHSTTILNSAFPNEINVISHTDEGTKVKGLKNIEEIEEFIQSSDFNLGDLWVSGAISGVPSDE